MTEHQVTVEAHAAVNLEVEVSEPGGRRDITVPAGQRSELRLTGDQIGRVRAELEAQRNNVQAHPENLKGGVTVQTEGYGTPPPGSKKWLQWYHDPTREDFGPNSTKPVKADLQEALDQLGVRYEDDATKAELQEKVPNPR